MTKSPNLFKLLGAIVEPERILTRPIDLIAFASDASSYRLIPKAVVLSRGVEEIRALFDFSRRYRIPLTFRAAGTSLSGQAVTDGILVEAARHWREVKVEADGKTVRVQPGAIGGHVNRLLSQYGAKIGPDPASIDACMIGGILSNNSSGMCCGISHNAYNTLQSMTFLLPSGTVIDTSRADADLLFRTLEPKLAEGLLQLKNEIHADRILYERIRHKYSIKNTVGYSLNAFVDFDRPVDIFRHLLIGSEGTLAFIAEAVLKTVPDLPVRYTGLLLFYDLYAACDAIAPLRAAQVQAIELMDREALRSVQGQKGVPACIEQLPGQAAGLLVEFQSANEEDRAALEAAANNLIKTFNLSEPAVFTHRSDEQALLWKVRKGMFPSVGAARPSGTAVILEDLVFPVERLADAVFDLRGLFTKHGYEQAIIFGHAKDGNLHFVISQSFAAESEIDRYERLMDDVVALVVEKYDGSLKGEHGTGRNMAPFVETEWGRAAMDIMRRLKILVDPQNLLNPGVIINASPKAHLLHLKTLPLVEDEVNKCTECGYCESRCPSRDLTLTPRQRITVRREMARLANLGMDGRKKAFSLEADFPYMALDTCAVDGLCALACPVGIDTGALTKRLRQEQHSWIALLWARFMAEHFSWAERGWRFALRTGHLGESIFVGKLLTKITKWARSLTGIPLPLWTKDLPYAASVRTEFGTDRARTDAVYFPSCISRILGFLPGEPRNISLIGVMATLTIRAGLQLTIREDGAGTCCGLPFSSKGFHEAHVLAVNRTIDRFWEWSSQGRLPIVIDNSPCSLAMLTCRPYLKSENQKRFDQMRILDGVAFSHDELLPRLKINRKKDTIAIHPVCSLTKMNLVTKLEVVCRACSQSVFIPRSAACCGFAGDRGLLFQELTESATREQATEIRTGTFDGFFSSSRTCEIGMSRAVGSTYRSYLYLLEWATRDVHVMPDSACD